MLRIFFLKKSSLIICIKRLVAAVWILVCMRMKYLRMKNIVGEKLIKTGICSYAFNLNYGDLQRGKLAEVTFCSRNAS